VPLHLEDHLDIARIEGSEVPKDLPDPLEWRFDHDVQGWKATIPLRPGLKKIQASHHDDALRMTLTKDSVTAWGNRVGTVHVELAGLNHDDWGFLIIEARTKDDISWMSPAFNLRKKRGIRPDEQGTFLFWGDNIDVINDGEIHSYAVRMDEAWPENEEIPWTELGISVGTVEQKKDDSRMDRSHSTSCPSRSSPGRRPMRGPKRGPSGRRGAKQAAGRSTCTSRQDRL